MIMNEQKYYIVDYLYVDCAGARHYANKIVLAYSHNYAINAVVSEVNNNKWDDRVIDVGAKLYKGEAV